MADVGFDALTEATALEDGDQFAIARTAATRRAPADLIRAVQVALAIPLTADADKKDLYGTSADDDDGLTSPVNTLREGHISIMTMRSDYLGEERSGYARYKYPALSSFGNPSHRGGHILEGDPVGLIGVVVLSEDGKHDTIFVEAATDGDGSLAAFVTGDASGTLKIRYRPHGATAWTGTIALPNASTPRTDVKRWTSDAFADSLVDPPLGTHLNAGTGSADSVLWDVEILDASDDSAIELNAGAWWSNLDEKKLSEALGDLWGRIVAQIAAQLNMRIVDVTGGSPPPLNVNNYRALFIDYSIPRIWMGWDDVHSGTDPVGSFTAFSHTHYHGSGSTNPASNRVLGDWFYNDDDHVWRTFAEVQLEDGTVVERWVNDNIEHAFEIPNIVWLQERGTTIAALRRIRDFDTTKTYIYFDQTRTVSSIRQLTNSTYVAGEDQYSTYDLLTVFSPNTEKSVGIFQRNILFGFDDTVPAGTFFREFALSRAPVPGSEVEISFHSTTFGASNDLEVQFVGEWFEAADFLALDPVVAATDYDSIDHTLVARIGRITSGSTDSVSNATNSAASLFVARISDSRMYLGLSSSTFWGQYVGLEVQIAEVLPTGVLNVIESGGSSRYFPVSATNVTGTANAIALTSGVTLSALVSGDTFFLIAEAANTAAVTVDVDGMGAKALKLPQDDGTFAELITGNIYDGVGLLIVYDGDLDEFHILSGAGLPVGQQQAPASAGNGGTFLKKYQRVASGTTPADAPPPYDTAASEFETDFGDWVAEDPGGAGVLWVSDGGWAYDVDANPQNLVWRKYPVLAAQYAVVFQDSATHTLTLESDSRFVRFLLPGNTGYSAWSPLADGSQGWVDLVTNASGWRRVDNNDIVIELPGGGFDGSFFEKIRFELESQGLDGAVVTRSGFVNVVEWRRQGQWSTQYDETSPVMDIGNYKIRYNDIAGLNVIPVAGPGLSEITSGGLAGSPVEDPWRRFSFELALIAMNGNNRNLITHVVFHNHNVTNGGRFVLSLRMQ